MRTDEYLMVVLGEEAIEVAHASSKVLRFTPHDSHTIGGPTNLEHLVTEFNELLAVVEMLKEEGLDLKRDEDIIARKKQRVKDYLEYSKKIGVVEC